MPDAGCRQGFTLIEILIAIGILSVGLLCAAALFPAAVMENQNAYSNSMGALICENGLAILRSKMRHEEISVVLSPDPTPLDRVPMKLGFGTSPRNFLGDDGADGFYPSGDTNSSKGFTGVIRRVNGTNCYDLTVVSYDRVESSTSIKATVVGGGGTGTLSLVARTPTPGHTTDPAADFVTTRFTVPGSDYLGWFQREALIVLYTANGVIAGRVAYVRKDSSGNTNVYLDRRLPDEFTTGAASACVVAEGKETGDGSLDSSFEPSGLPSPVMSTITARVAL